LFQEAHQFYISINIVKRKYVTRKVAKEKKNILHNFILSILIKIIKVLVQMLLFNVAF